MADAYIPTVVIIGRPNVGKSTVFNLLVKKRASIVESTPGVTRDRLLMTAELKGRKFDLIDTGGIGIVDEQALAREIESQIEAAIDMADLVLFMVDIQAGMHVAEQDIARQLRKKNKNVLFVANKADSPSYDNKGYEFLNLGFDEPLIMSVNGKRNLETFRNALVEALPESGPEAESSLDPNIPKIAVIGRRNVGKSSLVNALAREERVIVSNIAGTTRDAIDVHVEMKEGEYILIDTAGLRRKKSLSGSIEFYGTVRTMRSINRADGVLLLLDAEKGIGKIDKHVARDIVDRCKPCVIVVNKWDLSGQVPTGEYTAYVAKQLPVLHYAPVVYMSVQDRKHIHSPMKVLKSLIEASGTKIQTSKLNRIIQQAVDKRKPKAARSSKRPKIYYAVQVDVSPPEFRIYVNDPKLITKEYIRYLANSIRNNSDLSEVSIRIKCMERPKGDKRAV